MIYEMIEETIIGIKDFDQPVEKTIKELLAIRLLVKELEHERIKYKDSLTTDEVKQIRYYLKENNIEKIKEIIK